MTDMEKRAAARNFVNAWKDRKNEKQDTQSFWLSLLQQVYGLDDPASHIRFEVPVMLEHVSYIDGYKEAETALSSELVNTVVGIAMQTEGAMHAINQAFRGHGSDRKRNG